MKTFDRKNADAKNAIIEAVKQHPEYYEHSGTYPIPHQCRVEVVGYLGSPGGMNPRIIANYGNHESVIGYAQVVERDGKYVCEEINWRQ